jgi:3-oxoadipate enol-lactonase
MTTDALHVTDVGSGRPVVLLHGCPLPAPAFGGLVERLRVDRRVVVPDLPGYGRSPALTGEVTLPRIHALLEDTLSGLGIADCDCVGYSLGGYHAFALALRGRIRIGTIFSVGGFAGLDRSAAAGYAQLAGALRSGANVVPTLSARAFAPGYAQAHPEHDALLHRYVQDTPTEVWAAEMDALSRAEDLRPRLPSLSCKIFLRTGEADDLVPSAWTEDIARVVSSAELQRVPNVAHMYFLEDAEGTIAAIAKALGA